MKTYVAVALLLTLNPLHAVSDETAEDLRELLADPSRREELVSRGEAMIPIAAEVLQDRDADFHQRSGAAFVLGGIGGELCVEPLRAVLDDPSISWAAVCALGEIGSPAMNAVDDLARIAGADVDPTSNEGFAAERAIEAIGKIGFGSEEAVDALVRCMSRGRNYDAALALTKLGAPGAEALFDLAAKYADSEQPYQERRRSIFGDRMGRPCSSTGNDSGFRTAS